MEKRSIISKKILNQSILFGWKKIGLIGVIFSYIIGSRALAYPIDNIPAVETMYEITFAGMLLNWIVILLILFIFILVINLILFKISIEKKKSEEKNNKIRKRTKVLLIILVILFFAAILLGLFDELEIIELSRIVYVKGY